MDPIAVTAALLRAQLPDVPIREGASMMARVASRGESHAVLVIAGIPITAELPPEIQAGATLKLKVKEVSAERVWLRSTRSDCAHGRPARRPPRLSDPLIGQRRRRRSCGRTSRSRSRRGAAAAPTASPPTSSRWPSTRPTLGRLDLRLELRGERSWPK